MRQIQSYSDISIEELIAVGHIENLESMEAARKIVELFYGSPDNMSIQTFWDCYWEVTAVLYQKPEPQPIDRFKLYDVEYRSKTLDEFSTKAFIDFDNLSREHPIDNILLLLAVCYTDGNEDENYVEGVKARAELFKHLDAETALNALHFFLTLLAGFAEVIVGSSPLTTHAKKEELMKMLKDYRDSLGM